MVKFKKSLKVRNSKFQKSKQYFCKDHWEENSEKKGWKDSKVIWGRSSVLKVWLPLGPMHVNETKNISKKIQKLKKKLWVYGRMGKQQPKFETNSVQ